MRTGILIHIILLLVVFWFSCTNQGGIGHEGEARISGKLLLPDGTAAAETEITLHAAAYDPIKDTVTDISETTDADGRYRFRDIAPGTYTLVAVHKNRTDRALISAVSVADTMTMVPPTSLKQIGAMKVLLTRQVSGEQGYLYIPGTSLFRYINNKTTSVVIDSVPAGTVSEVSYNSASSDEVLPVSRNIAVVSNDTTEVTMPYVGYTRNIRLNTTSSGAAIVEDVVNFPVLIRLTSQNFDFLQAQETGTDLYFKKSDGTVLPHSIERWDATRQAAEIWVKVDTVFGNDSTQSITMHWGDPAAKPDVSVNSVFDTADGYQGVWHLGDDADSPVTDATDNHFNSGAPQSTFPSITPGIIGNGRSFDGSSSYLAIPNSASARLDVPASGHYSVSAWVYLDSLDGESHCIVSKGYEQYYLRATNITGNVLTDVAKWEFVEYDGTTAPKPTQSPAKGGEWVFVAGVRQGTQQLLYINGVLTSRVDLPPGTIARSSSFDLYIGRFSSGLPSPIDQGYCYFRGSIDELRINSTAYSADRIKLSYMNQRVDDKLVIFQELKKGGKS